MNSLPLALVSAVSDLDSLFLGSRAHELLNSGLNQVKPFLSDTFMRVPVNIYETETKVIAIVQLPGIDKTNVNLNVVGQNLTISAQNSISQTTDDEKHQYHLSEFRYGKLERTIRLPPSADTSNVNAQMENGLLRITFEKHNNSANNRIKIA